MHQINTSGVLSLPELSQKTLKAPTLQVSTYLPYRLQAYFRAIASLDSDHSKKANTAVTQVTQMFWFPTAYKRYVYTIL